MHNVDVRAPERNGLRFIPQGYPHLDETPPDEVAVRAAVLEVLDLSAQIIGRQRTRYLIMQAWEALREP